MSETQQALEPIQDPYLDLIREVTGNPELSAEKLKILVDMRLLLEDREAEKSFDAAMKNAQKEVVALKWDKKGDNNHYVKYPTIEKMLRPIREKFGFTQSFDAEVSPVAGQMIFCCDVSHDGGHTKRYRLPMSIDGQGPKGGGVMTGAQAVGNGTSYAMRYLQKMIWNIPMLVDKDDNDGNEPKKVITASQVADLRALADEAKRSGETGADVIKGFCEYMKIDKIENLPVAMFKSAVTAFNKRKNAK
jgi:hypothetical protein